MPMRNVPISSRQSARAGPAGGQSDTRSASRCSAVLLPRDSCRVSPSACRSSPCIRLRLALDYDAKPLPFGFRIANAAVEPYVWLRMSVSDCLAVQTGNNDPMARAFLFVLDSFGIGGAADAERYGDAGANTLAHIAEACAEGRADREGLRQGPLSVPHMASLGLGRAAETATGLGFAHFGTDLLANAFHGAAQEVSSGKDTPSGHWEIAGLPVRFDWGYFPDTVPAFPAELTEAMIREGEVPGILGNCHAPGTEIIERFGEEHIRTGKPICYTSVNSVLQIAAHEVAFRAGAAL